MGVVSGDCCGLVRYQTVLSIGKIMYMFAIDCYKDLGIFLVVADTALFVINIGNTWSA